jgi:hypothetical protein
MSSKGIDIGITSDSRDFVKAVDEGTESLEDLSGALDDAAKDGDKAADKLTDSFDETVKKVNELGDKSESAMRRMSKSTSDAGEGVKNLKEDSVSTAKEAAASFDGSAESIVDAFQEVAANAFVGFGAKGVAAGLAAAAGLGLIVAAFEELDKKQKENEQRAADLAATYIEVGDSVVGAIEASNDKLKEMALTTDDNVMSLTDLQKAAERMGVPFEDLARAYAGNSDEIDRQIELLEEKRQIELDSYNKNARNADDLQKSINDRYNEQIEGLKEVNESVEEAQAIEQAYYDSGAARAAEKATAISNINDEYDQVVNSVTDYVNAETGILDVEAYLKAIETRRQALVDYQNDLAASNLTDEQKTQLNAMGTEAAAVWLDAYTSPSTSDDQKRRMSASLKEASSEASGVAIKTVETAFSDGVKTELKIETKTGIDAAKKALDALAADERSMRLRVTVVDQNGRVIP